MPRQKISDRKLIAVCRDLVETDDFQQDIAKRHGINPDYLASLKKTDRFQNIYQQVLSAEIAKGANA